MDIRSSLAAQSYAASRPATAPGQGQGTQGKTADFGKVAAELVSTLQNGENTARDAMLGKTDNLALVQALAQSELAVEAAVTVRDKVVEAYQEILRMPV